MTTWSVGCDGDVTGWSFSTPTGVPSDRTRSRSPGPCDSTRMAARRAPDTELTSDRQVTDARGLSDPTGWGWSATQASRSAPSPHEARGRRPRPGPGRGPPRRPAGCRCGSTSEKEKRIRVTPVEQRSLTSSSPIPSRAQFQPRRRPEGHGLGTHLSLGLFVQTPLATMAVSSRALVARALHGTGTVTGCAASSTMLPATVLNGPVRPYPAADVVVCGDGRPCTVYPGDELY